MSGGVEVKQDGSKPRYTKRLSQQQEYYDRTVQVRWAMLHPLVRLLVRLGISANAVSYSALVFMAPVVFLMREHPGISAGLILASTAVDLIDGLVARYTSTDSDRGKLVDMVCDNVAFTLFVLGLVYGDLTDPISGLLLTYLMILSKVLRSIMHSFFLETDWYIRAVAGFLPNAVVALSYFAFVVWAVSGFEVFTALCYGLSALLGIDCAVFYLRILRDAPIRNGKD